MDRLTSDSDQASARTCKTIVQFLESGVRGNPESHAAYGLALGVSEADLGLVQKDVVEEEFILEEFSQRIDLKDILLCKRKRSP